jgi:hypothetical protein
VDDSLLVDAVLDLAGFCVFDGCCNIGCDGARFWIWHETAWSEQSSVFTEARHVLWSCHEYVEIQLFFVELLEEFLVAYDVSASGFGCGVVTFWCKYGNAYAASGTVWQCDGCADVLVGLAWIDTEANVNFDACVKFYRACFGSKLDSICQIVCFASFNFFSDIFELFATVVKRARRAANPQDAFKDPAYELNTFVRVLDRLRKPVTLQKFYALEQVYYNTRDVLRYNKPKEMSELRRSTKLIREGGYTRPIFHDDQEFDFDSLKDFVFEDSPNLREVLAPYIDALYK